MKLSCLVLLLFVTACGGGKEEPAGPRKLSKMNVRVSVDTKGRIQPMFELYDQKMKAVSITGTYRVAIARSDGTELCKVEGEFTPTDFTDTSAYRAEYRDASCPAEPGAKDLKVVVKVASADKTIERTLELPARTIYENLKAPTPVPATGSAATGSTGSASTGSATGSASMGSASAGSAGEGSGSAGKTSMSKGSAGKWSAGKASAGSAGSAGSAQPAEAPSP